VLLDDRNELVEPRNFTLGAEDAVGDDQRSFTRVEPAQRRVERLRIGVLVANEASAGSLAEANAVVEGCVHVAIDDRDRALVREQRRARREVRLIPGRENERRLFAEERRELLFELVVQLHRAVDETRPGHAGAEAVDGCLGRLTDLRVSGEPEVIVRPEHDDALAVDHRFGSVVQVERLEERIHAHGARVVRGHELVTLLENVLAADAGQGGSLLQRLVE